MNEFAEQYKGQSVTELQAKKAHLLSLPNCYSVQTDLKYLNEALRAAEKVEYLTRVAAATDAELQELFEKAQEQREYANENGRYGLKQQAHKRLYAVSTEQAKRAGGKPLTYLQAALSAPEYAFKG